MSSAIDLKDWIAEHHPELERALESPASVGIPLLNGATGLCITMQEFDAQGPDAICAMYLGALKLLAAPLRAEAKPKKPPPALPVEAWATREFDAEQAHAVTLSLCRGQ